MEQEQSAAINKTPIPWYIYMIETRHGHLYTGISTNWQRRYNEHQHHPKKAAKFLRGKGPLTVKYVAMLDDHSCALQAEIWLKKQSKQKKLQVISHQFMLPFKHTIMAIESPS